MKCILKQNVCLKEVGLNATAEAVCVLKYMNGIHSLDRLLKKIVLVLRYYLKNNDHTHYYNLKQQCQTT